MRLQLRGSKVTPEQQRANDTHRPLIVAAVIGMLLVYAYLFTPLAAYLGLRMPIEVLGSMGQYLKFDEVGHLYCRVSVTSSPLPVGSSLLIVLGVLTAAFLCAYWAPLPYKRPLAAGWFLVAFLAIYGPWATGLLLLAHLAVYLVFHSRARGSRWLAAGFGALLGFAVLESVGTSLPVVAAGAAVSAVVIHVLYAYALTPLLAQSSRAASIIQTLVIQIPLTFAVVAALYEGMTGDAWSLSLGLLFVFWQWQRLMVYHADFKAGDVPKALSFLDYLAVFLTPGVMNNWQSAQYVGQAYTYLANNFLRRDKNAIVLSGVRIWGLALFYILLGEPFIRVLVAFFHQMFGVTVYTSTLRLVQEYVDGVPQGMASVLLTTLLDQFRIFLVFGALTHFRVGTWRVLGHDMDPQYNRPWLATNLVTFWGRFAFHYREFLVRTFYYPVFFRFFKKSLYLRIFFATFISTSIGNHIWGHVPDRMYSRTMTLDNLIGILRAWPYYLLLGLGIALTQLYLMRKGRTRRAWTLDRRIGLDVLASYATMQYFSLIHIFARPIPESNLTDHIRLFLIGFGIHI